ncbi:alcohol oxidase [Lindgomyces ingoldianus]|uniref:Alcohol oxidase n=1 Tax=Lindgomyces ingoldianus TaxID=673940 RepID=A0ACB6QP78_9PLEO|nr:alcohol oxidase [Lindgomyces ingoldianus]KAF2468793.1 alcohol oxidase [Lindgomyces ingoldianus]
MSTYEDGLEYDIIFAGGGTSACVAAGRLAKAGPNLTILIIERGRNNLNDPIITNPNAIFYQAESEPALNGQARIVAAGGVLGGGSSINAMMYARAQGVDFDSFRTDGWDSKNLVEYVKKLETVHLDDQLLEKSTHGFSGPVNVTFGTHAPKGPQDDFLVAAESYGIPEIHDLQDFKAIGGFNRSAKFIGLDGKRQDAVHCYVNPLMADGNHQNLHTLAESKVSRVIFEGNHAFGVEYKPEKTFLQQGTSLTKGIAKTIKARKLVVVSAGALGTPSILERSGVGNKELQAGVDILLVSNLPGVGENYQDHHFLLPTYKTSLGADETLDGLITGRRDFVKALGERDSILGWNGIDIGGKLRMTNEEVATLGPEFKTMWDKDFANCPKRPIMLMGVIAGLMGDHKMLDEGPDGVQQYVTMASYTPYPYPLWAYKKGRDIYRRTNAFEGEVATGHPKFREGSRAALSEGPLKTSGFCSVKDRSRIPPVEYDEEDNRAIEDFVRANVQTTWHSLGTCKMAPRDEGGVVDKYLNVYGTRGLKCADLSIIPENIGANTNNMALIVGEKAADIIGKVFGLVV